MKQNTTYFIKYSKTKEGEVDMLQVTLLELFARGLPEASLFILASFVFSNSKFNLNRFILSTTVYALLVYIIRLLPIQYGVNNILTIFALIALNVGLNNIYIIKSIKIAIFVFIIQFVCEGFNLYLLQYVFKVDIEYIFSNPQLKVMYGIPSLAIFGVVLGIYYFLVLKRKRIESA